MTRKAFLLHKESNWITTYDDASMKIKISLMLLKGDSLWVALSSHGGGQQTKTNLCEDIKSGKWRVIWCDVI